jgi:RNA polymerase sigma-70 factor (ECF subfamily)
MTDELHGGSVADEALIARIVSGDEAAFTALFRRRQADVYRVALLMTGSPATAEDVTQEVFLVVMREAARYEAGRSTVKAWLCGISRNQARRRLDRDRRIEPIGEDPEREIAQAVVHPDPVGDLDHLEQVQALRQAILKLPLRYRDVVVLCDLEELSYVDAAAALDCAVGTVRSRLHRARALLAAKMRSRRAAGIADAAQPISRCLA